MSRDYNPNYKFEPTFFVVGGKAIIQKDNKILLLQRSEKSGNGGLWSFPGGAVENEDATQGIEREITEELLIKIKNIRPFAVKTYFEKKPTIIIGYTCDYDSGEIDLNWEHDQYEWIDAKDTLNYELTPDAKFFAEKYLENKIKG